MTAPADESVAEAEVSVSRGLIVTELVINALKHAFPGGAGAGRSRSTIDSDWTLEVCDDGVGIPSHDAQLKGRLGSTIVMALARQLDAQVEIADGQPGAEVRIVHAGAPAATAAERVAAV